MNATIKEAKLDKKQALRNAAILATTGAAGNEFWKEVAERVTGDEAEGPKVQPRKVRENS